MTSRAPSPPGTSVALIGTVGLPPRYGGFETLAAALVEAAKGDERAPAFTVYCSAQQAPDPRPETWHGAALRYLPLRANGPQSIAYDMLSLLDAARRGHRTALVLGVSGTLILPLFRLVSGMRLVVHLDGIEWQRPKWRGAARLILRLSERAAVRWAHEVIADNPEIARHVRETYGRTALTIAYGHEHALATPPGDITDLHLPPRYRFALARVEPENNFETILTACAADPRQPLVAVGNWDASAYGRALRQRFKGHQHLHLLDAVYNPARLRALRDRATVYLHGHSAGGTNPALVEMMGLGAPVIAHDNPFNRATTEGAALYFNDADTLAAQLKALDDPATAAAITARLKRTAETRYRWSDVTAAYFRALAP